MGRRFLLRTMNGFCYSIAITLVVQLAEILLKGSNPMLPEFMEKFDSPVKAFAVQLLLIGVMSGLTSAGMIVFEAKKIGLLVQSILFLIILSAIWIPVSCFVWGFHKYLTSMIVTIISLALTYGICWWVQYRLCKGDIEAINAKLLEKKGQ